MGFQAQKRQTQLVSDSDSDDEPGRRARDEAWSGAFMKRMSAVAGALLRSFFLCFLPVLLLTVSYTFVVDPETTLPPVLVVCVVTLTIWDWVAEYSNEGPSSRVIAK